nr:unnamed protein product [Digitaria exilis]
MAADDVRELLLSTTADASDPSTPLSAPDLRLLIDRLRLRSDRLHASALSFAASHRGALASSLARAASAADSAASLESSLDSALAPLASSPDLSDLKALADRLLAARQELGERQEHLAAASTIASLAARLREARAATNPLDTAAAAAELKPLLIDPERPGSGQDDPVVFGLLRSDWEQLVDELQVGLAKNVEECMKFAVEGGKVVVSATPRGSSSRTHGVELPVALQALEIIDALDYGMAKIADLMIKHILVPAISKIHVTVSVEVLEEGDPKHSVSVLSVVPSEELKAVPNEASKLIDFQDVVRSTAEFENELRSMMFLLPDRKDGKLTPYVDDVEVHFAVRKRSEILVKARNILVQYDYDNPLESGNRDDSVVDLLFLSEKCFTSKSALLLMELVHGALKVEKQLDSISQVAAIVHNDFYHLSQEIIGLAFQRWASLLPPLQSFELLGCRQSNIPLLQPPSLLANVPPTIALPNFPASTCARAACCRAQPCSPAVAPYLLPSLAVATLCDFPIDLQKQVVFVDLAPIFSQMAEVVLRRQIQLAIDTISKAIDGADGFQNTHQPQHYESAKFSIEQTVFILEKIRIMWESILPKSTYRKKLLDMSLKSITAAWESGDLVSCGFTSSEVQNFVKAIFADSPLRKECHSLSRALSDEVGGGRQPPTRWVLLLLIPFSAHDTGLRRLIHAFSLGRALPTSGVRAALPRVTRERPSSSPVGATPSSHPLHLCCLCVSPSASPALPPAHPLDAFLAPLPPHAAPVPPPGAPRSSGSRTSPCPTRSLLLPCLLAGDDPHI